GTLPVFVVRGIGDQLGQVGFGEIELVGRYVSATFDVFTVLLVYLITKRLYKKNWVALLASSFAAFSVLPIQQAHFLTVDSFANFFITLTFYFGVIIFTKEPLKDANDELNPLEIIEQEDQQRSSSKWAWLKNDWVGFLPYAAFGIAYGMALASKISAFPIAILLPISAYFYYRKLRKAGIQKAADLIVRNVILAGVLAVLAFRICQPYAFAGPGFFNVSLNPKWVANMTELSNLSGGDVDFPPALQWARRPLTFSLENMVTWGLGLPLGLLACAGFLWMGFKMIKGEAQKHFLLWAWTGAFFTWQSVNFTRSMRYQLPIYPALAVIAAWLIGYLWYAGKNKKIWLQYLAASLGVVALVGSVLWSYAFTRIYTRPVTRIAASEWIYQNVPAAINLPINTESGVTNQPVPFRLGETVSMTKPIILAFTPEKSGELSDLKITYALDPQMSGSQKTVVAMLSENKPDAEMLSTGLGVGDFSNTAADPRGSELSIAFNPPVILNAGTEYRVQILPATEADTLLVGGPITYGMVINGEVKRLPLPESVEPLEVGKPFLASFNALASGSIDEVYFYRLGDRSGSAGDKTINVMLAVSSDQPSSTATITAKFDSKADYRGEEVWLKFDRPLNVVKGETYILQVEQISGGGQIGIYATKQAFESSWDDPLPLSMYGIDPYGYSNGVYRTDLNFEMYWDDNAEKLTRFENVMDQADYIYISSGRQWGTTVRVPERYPLTTEYYRNLLGCPIDQDIVDCYRVAEVGTYQGKLGFELVKVFQSDPNLGSLRVNTQFAEEAFTVYDHPKVMLFKKTDTYTSEKV
ncbi:MAG: phospholipid carrier-dependent glycosyltransferase, partial [Anaerolineaceae bacterium]|nr:phospholipid carrier-dependent glycosyltransferase [Anaerolineaceae bacterium]